MKRKTKYIIGVKDLGTENVDLTKYAPFTSLKSAQVMRNCIIKGLIERGWTPVLIDTYRGLYPIYKLTQVD
jgi:hypothetical protein